MDRMRLMLSLKHKAKVKKWQEKRHTMGLTDGRKSGIKLAWKTTCLLRNCED
jgi:hypothetical protein